MTTQTKEEILAAHQNYSRAEHLFLDAFVGVVLSGIFLFAGIWIDISLPSGIGHLIIAISALYFVSNTTALVVFSRQKSK